MNKRFWSVEEARAALHSVDIVMERALKLHRALEQMDDVEIEFVDDYEQTVHDIRFNKKWHQLSHALFTELHALLELGCIVKDLDEALVDFYAVYQGREIFLCYQYGEGNITHWHEVDTGYEERRPVEELMEKNV